MGRTEREIRLQLIYEHIEACQYELLLSKELSEYPIPPEIKAVHDKLEEARELLRAVKREVQGGY